MKQFAPQQRSLAGILSVLLAILATTVGGCGGSSDNDGTSSPPAHMLGPAGGTVTQTGSAANAAGARLDIPPGALASDTAIVIEEGSSAAPALPTGITAFGAMFKLTPHGTVFAKPVMLTLPVPATAPPAGTRLALYKTTAGQGGVGACGRRHSIWRNDQWAHIEIFIRTGGGRTAAWRRSNRGL